MSSSSVLITGGSSGIGRALAERYSRDGSQVYVTSRKASDSVDKIVSIQSDISYEHDRLSLSRHVKEKLPNLNILVLNAGIQLHIPIARALEHEWSEEQTEINTLLSGPIHLCNLLIPVMLAHGQPSQIVVVTSGLGIVPSPATPVYSACKAGMRSYVHLLRHSLKDTNIRVTEVLPPRVDTGLGDQKAGVDLKEFINSIYPRMLAGEEEVGYGTSESEGVRDFRNKQRELFLTRVKTMAVETFASRMDK